MLFLLINRMISVCKKFDTVVTWLFIQGIEKPWFIAISATVLISQAIVGLLKHDFVRVLTTIVLAMIIVGIWLYSRTARFGDYLYETVVVQIMKDGSKYYIHWNNGGRWYRVWFTSSKRRGFVERVFFAIIKSIVEHNRSGTPVAVSTFRNGFTRTGA